MGAVYSIVKLDLRGIRRDQVAVATIALSLIGTAAIAALGAFHDRLPGWSAWFPFMVAVSLASGPASFGFLFGLLMVDEGDAGVRQALAVSPVPPTVFILVRTAVATAWMAAWPLASVYLMNSTWGILDIPFTQWLAIVGPLALFTPAFALAIPTAADDKLGALAVFKVLSFASLAPLALFFVPANAAYRLLFLVPPTGWTIEAFRALLDHRAAAGYAWASGGIVYAVVLTAAAVHMFRNKIYSLRH